MISASTLDFFFPDFQVLPSFYPLPHFFLIMSIRFSSAGKYSFHLAINLLPFFVDSLSFPFSSVIPLLLILSSLFLWNLLLFFLLFAPKVGWPLVALLQPAAPLSFCSILYVKLWREEHFLFFQLSS